MKRAILAILVLTGCKDINRALNPSDVTCNTYYTQEAYVTNWTGAPVNFEMSYQPYYGEPYAKTQIRAATNQTVKPLLATFTKSSTYSSQTKCSNETYSWRTTLNLTSDSYSMAKACVLNSDVRHVILVASTASCPIYSTQQETAK